LLFAALSGCSGSSGGRDPVSVAAMPRVFIYGDSIRMGWEPEIRHLSANNWVTWSGGIFNGAYSDTMRGILEGDFPFFQHYDLYYLSAGLWDALEVTGQPFDLDRYEDNWRTALRIVQRVDPEAVVIVAATTSVGDNFDDPTGRLTPEVVNQRVDLENDTLRALVTEASASGQRAVFHDLRQFAEQRGLSRVDGVHFDDAGYDLLAAEVYSEIFLQLLESGKLR
jgi:hypothetical protein